MNTFKYLITFVFSVYCTYAFGQELSCPDTIYVCNGQNTYTYVDGNGVIVNVRDISFFPCGGIYCEFWDITVDDNQVTYNFNYVLETLDPSLPLQFLLSTDFGGCMGTAIYNADVLDLPERCLPPSDTLEIDLPCQSEIYKKYCLGDTVFVPIRNIISGKVPNEKMRPDRIQSSLGRVLSVTDYGFTIVWENAGLECLEFTTSNDGECTSTRWYTIEVIPTQKAKIVNTLSADTFCLGDSPRFSLQNVPGYPINWRMSDGQADYTAFFEPRLTTPGIYTIIGEVLFRPTAGGSIGPINTICPCFIPDTIQIVVRGGDAFDILCDGPICAGDTATYFASEQCDQYNWSVSPEGHITGGGGLLDPYVQVAWQSIAQGIVSLNLESCGSFCKSTVHKTIPVIADGQSIRGPDVVCGDAINTYDIPDIPGATYQWNLVNNKGILSGIFGFPNRTDLYTYPIYGIYTDTAHLSVRYDHCGLQCGGKADKKVAIKNSFSILANTNQGCLGETVTFSNNHDVELDYTTIFPDGTTSTSSGNTSMVIGDQAGLYRVVGKDPLQRFCNDEANLSFRIYGPPSTPDTILGPAEICTYRPSLYELASLGMHEEVQWTFVDGNRTIMYTTSQPSVTHYWRSSAGPYEISVVVKNTITGCSSAAYNQSKFPEIYVEGDTTVCIYEKVLYDLPAVFDRDVEWSIEPPEAGTISTSFDNSISIQWLKTGEHTLRYRICGIDYFAKIEVIDLKVDYINYDRLICYSEKSTIEIGSQPDDIVVIYDIDGKIVGTTDRLELSAGLYLIEVTGPNGCTYTENIGIEDYKLPVPVISSTTFANTFCFFPGSIVLETESFGEGITYQWYRNGIMIPGETSKLYNATTFGSYEVGISDASGCTTLSPPYLIIQDCGGSGDPEPSNLITFDNEALLSCQNQQLTVTPPYNSTVFNWGIYNLVTGLYTAVMGNPIVFNFNDVGHYKVRVTGNMDEGGKGIVTIAAISKFKSKDRCSGVPIEFSNTSRLLFDPSEYYFSWDFGDPASGTNNTSSDFDGQHTYSTEGTYTITLTITHPVYGCSSTATETIVVEKEQLEILAPDTICHTSQPITYLSQKSNPNSEVTWNFKTTPNDSVETNGDQIDFGFPLTGNYGVIATARSPNGCIVRDTHDIVVGRVPILGQIRTDIQIPKCPSSTVSLMSPLSHNYLWNTGEITQNIAVTDVGDYNVILTDIYGCEVTKFITVENIPLSNARICAYTSTIANDATCDRIGICANTRIRLFTTRDENYSYKWSVNNVNDYLIEFVPTVGSHLITVDITDTRTNCTVTTDPFIIEVYSRPTPPQLALDGPPCNNTNTRIYIMNPDTKVTYNWYSNISNPDGYTGTERIANQSRTYAVATVDTNGCTSTLSQVYISSAPVPTGWFSGCYNVCFPDTFCLSTQSGVSYSLRRDGELIQNITYPSDQLIIQEAGSYSILTSNLLGCSIETEPLDLTPKPENHQLSGMVYLDDNDNDSYDPDIDQPMENIKVYLRIGLSVVDSTWTNSMGQYIFDPLTQGLGHTVSLNDSDLEPYLLGTRDSLAIFYQCSDSVVIDFPLFIECVPSYQHQALTICSGDTISYLGNIYFESTVDSLTLQGYNQCDSIIILEITVLDVPDITFEIQNSCVELANGSINIEAPFGSLVSLDSLGPFEALTSFDQLDTGLYSLFVMSSEGCISSHPFTVLNNPTITFDLNIDTSCYNASTGTLDIVTDSQDKLLFSIDGENLSSNLTYGSLPSGKHTLMVRDTFGCESIFEVDVPKYELPNINAFTTPACENSFGAVQFSSTTSFILGPGYSPTFDTIVQSLSIGSHTYVLQFQNQCKDTIDILINQVPPPSLIIETAGSCSNLINGSLTIEADQYAGILTSLVDGPTYDSKFAYQNLKPGNHKLYYQDSLGCTYERTFVIETFPNPRLTAETSGSCSDLSSGTLTINTDADSIMLDFRSNWVHHNLPITISAGSHMIYAISNFGCLDSMAVDVPILPPLEVEFPEIEPDCSTEFIEIIPEVRSFAPPITYMWNTGLNQPTLNVSQSGLYSLTIQDYCDTLSHSWDIAFLSAEELDPLGLLPNIFAPFGSGENTCFNPIIKYPLDFYDYHFLIFDRWGNKVFDTTDRYACWDATHHDKKVESGVYVYVMELTTEVCGKPKRIQRVGDVTVLF